MKKLRIAGVVFALACCSPIWAQEAPGVPVKVVITAEPKHGTTAPELQQSEIAVREAGKPRQVESLTRIPPQAPVQLMLLIDNSGGTNLDLQIKGIKEWINSLPPNVQVGLGFMQNGFTQMAHPISADHAAVANAMHLPAGWGGADVDPYGSLSETIKKWPNTDPGVRREVVMISGGIEGLGGGIAPENPYVNSAIDQAQRADVIVFGIYNPSAGHLSHTFWMATMGQNLLSQLCYSTGGEAYMPTLSPPVSIAPFLQDIRLRLEEQYQLAFMAGPESKSGLQQLHVTVHDDNADAAAPTSVYVKASK